MKLEDQQGRNPFIQGCFQNQCFTKRWMKDENRVHEIWRKREWNIEDKGLRKQEEKMNETWKVKKKWVKYEERQHEIEWSKS